MKKIFKKSLAIMVSAAICLTALIGCLSVSAATRGEGTFTVGSDSGKPGESVTVPIKLAYTSSNGDDGMGIAASLFDVSFDTNALTITDIAAGEDATYMPDVEDKPGGEGVPPQDIYTVEYRSNGETISVVDDAVRILAMPAYNETVPADSETVLTSMTVKLTFRIKDGAAAQDYAITITKQQTCDYGQATPDELGNFTYADDEEFIDMTITNGKITVVEDAPVCTHENLEFVSAVPATEGKKGTITFECADCGEQITETVTYLVQSTLATPSIGCTSTTQLILRASVSANATATDNLLVVTHKYMNGAPEEIATYKFNDADSNGTIYSWNIGVKSVNFTDVFSTVLFTKRDGQWVSGMVRDFSIQNAAMSTIKDGTDEAIKLVCGNLLTMGAKAQIQFDYNPSALADAELADYPQYVTSTVPTVERTDDNFISVGTDFATQKKAVIATPSIALSDSIAFNFRVVTSYYEGATDDLKVVVNYESFNGAPISETYNIEYVEGTAIYNLSVGVIAPNMRQPVSFTVYNGDVPISDTAVYSIESVLATSVASENSLLDLVNAIINYSDSAQTAF